jgi:hypothetical protein
MELQLREGQANDSLERLRECLAEKSLRFRVGVRPAKGQKKSQGHGTQFIGWRIR